MGVILLISACASTPSEVPPVRLPLDVALHTSTPGSPALNVSIMVLESGADGHGVSAPLRAAEALYIPVLLKQTMEESGAWGAVRVLPDEDPSAELQITGRILDSDGIELSLHVTVRDATGRVWLDRAYSDYAFGDTYRGELNYLKDPFQDLYNAVVNDINEVRNGIVSEQLERILDTSMLIYASALAPEAFSTYLTGLDDGQPQLVALPARNDELYARVRRIRESEYGFTDTLDAAYRHFFDEVGQTYTYWRSYSYELVLGNENLERDNGDGVQRARSWQVLGEVYGTYKDSKLNEDALRQMTDSFDDEVTPTVASLEGAVVHLTGSLRQKYRQWRSILKQIYAEERGATTDQ